MSALAYQSPMHLAIEKIEKTFPGLAWANTLPEPDSYFTNHDFAFVVTEVDDTTIAEDCGSTAYSMPIDVTIYARKKCIEPGTMKALDRIVSQKLKELSGDYGQINISNVYRQTSNNLPYIDDNFKARVVSLTINYGSCNG